MTPEGKEPLGGWGMAAQFLWRAHESNSGMSNHLPCFPLDFFHPHLASPAKKMIIYHPNILVKYFQGQTQSGGTTLHQTI
jgi:hypothetical protein